MKNKMKLNNPKKKCIYIKNIYISKNPKLNNSINSYFEPKKLNAEINLNKNQSSTIIKQNTKKSVKSEYQNIYSQKQKCIIKGVHNYNYLSTKNIHIKSPKKEDIKDPNLFETYVDSISGRKSTQKKYETSNHLKERSNSENSLNYFTRTYTFFGNGKDKNMNNINGSSINNSNTINIKKNNNENKSNNSIKSTTKSSTNELKINLSNININKNIYNYKNNIKNGKKNNSNANVNNNTYIDSSYQKKNSKRYLYKESKDIITKKTTSTTINNNTNKFNNSLHNNSTNNEKDNKDKDAKDGLNSTELISYKNILSPNASNSNVNSISSSNDPNNNQDNNNNINTPNIQNVAHNKNSKRIQKYILSDKKRKTKSRQNFREYKYKEYKENKSKSICPESKKNSNNNSRIENKNNSKYNYIKNKSNDTQMKNKLFNKEIENNMIYNGANGTNNSTNYNDIRLLFEQSAVIIQSVFRGYLVKSRLETYLYNYKFYNQAVDILEKFFIDYLKNKCNIILEKKIFLLKISKFPSKIKNIKSYKSCKAFKLINIPTSPLTESDKTLIQNKFIDIYLHKEIGERFNIIKTNNNKELEKKHKEELDDVNNKIIKLIKENNILKNINQKNKINETKYKELSLENKKKENIINIITSDNQNLAKKLKNLKDKINQLEIQTPIVINLIQDNKNKYHIKYRNNYLIFLIKKKEIKYMIILKKYFAKYKNIIKRLNYENKINNFLKEKYLNNLVIIIRNNHHQLLRYFLKNLLYLYLFKKNQLENNNKIKVEKLKNLLLKKQKIEKLNLKQYFNSFHTKGILLQYIKETELNKQNKKEQILNNLKKSIISLNKRNILHNAIQYKNYFIKWTLVTRILSMKAVTDEKKRKKRQKQRTKRKIEKNKSEKKFLLSSSISQTINLDKNSVSTNIYEKEKNPVNKKKDKEKDNTNYFEHTVTTDFSLAETNNDIKNDKIIKGTEKLNDLFLKAAIFYKIFGNKNNKDINTRNKDNNNSNNNNNKDKKEIKVRLDNESDNDEDSGESSFGI